MHCDLQLCGFTLAVHSYDCSLLRARLGADSERDSFARFAQHARLACAGCSVPGFLRPEQGGADANPGCALLRSRRESRRSCPSRARADSGADTPRPSGLASSRKLRKQARVVSSATPHGAIVISPCTSRCSRPGRPSSICAASADSGSTPDFVSSGLSFTSSRTGSRLPSLPAASLSRSARRSESTESTRIEELRGAGRLVRLQMPDEVHANARIGGGNASRGCQRS